MCLWLPILAVLHVSNPPCWTPGLAAQVVCEEAEEPYRYGTINKGKRRFESGIVSPASPHYVYGLINETQVLALATRRRSIAHRPRACGRIPKAQLRQQ